MKNYEYYCEWQYSERLLKPGPFKQESLNQPKLLSGLRLCHFAFFLVRMNIWKCDIGNKPTDFRQLVFDGCGVSQKDFVCGLGEMSRVETNRRDLSTFCDFWSTVNGTLLVVGRDLHDVGKLLG